MDYTHCEYHFVSPISLSLFFSLPFFACIALHVPFFLDCVRLSCHVYFKTIWFDLMKVLQCAHVLFPFCLYLSLGHICLLSTGYRNVFSIQLDLPTLSFYFLYLAITERERERFPYHFQILSIHKLKATIFFSAVSRYQN